MSLAVVCALWVLLGVLIGLLVAPEPDVPDADEEPVIMLPGSMLPIAIDEDDEPLVGFRWRGSAHG